LYDETEKPSTLPEVTQWLDDKNLRLLKGKKILIVDEIDDTRLTLDYCVTEMKKLAQQVGVFVLHNKKKTKRGTIPSDVKYFACQELDDLWVVYPWDAVDIDEHDMKCQ